MQTDTDKQANYTRNTCPACGGPLLLFMSLNMKCCNDCRKEYTWLLEDKEKPMVQHQR